ncbi:MAG: Kae1-associated kinase Bud32 [Nanobdellota archaeon]
MVEQLSQGAESIIYRDGETVSKVRVAKSYRHPELDTSLRKSRSKREQKVLEKAHSLGIPVPDSSLENSTITMTYLPGLRLRDWLFSNNADSSFLKLLGSYTALLHNNTIVHGDLTTSNCIVSDGVLFLIDFGLSFFSTKAEDYAVDIHLLEQALESTHYKEAKSLFSAFLEGYSSSNNYSAVLDRLEVVRARGRNKH